MSLFWTGLLPQTVHHSSKAASSFSSISRYQDPDVSGRLTDNVTNKGTVFGTGTNSYRSFARPGFQHKLGKIYSETNSSHRVPGVSDRFSKNDVLIARIKGHPVTCTIGSQLASLRKDDSKAAGKLHRSVSGNCESSHNCSFATEKQTVLTKHLKPESSEKSDYQRLIHFSVEAREELL